MGRRDVDRTQEEVLAEFVALGGRLVDSSPMYGRADGGRGRPSREEHVDLMQVHNLVDVAEHLATLRAWKRAKRVRYIGVTHYTASAHEALARVIESESGLDFVQINYSVAEREAERRILSLAS